MVSTHNRASRLPKLFRALRAQTLATDQFEVIIVDNGSSDETPEVLAQEASAGGLTLQTIRIEKSLGPAGARERGWRAGSAPVVAFTDDDCAPDPQWLEAGTAPIAGDPQVIVQGETRPDPDELNEMGPFSRTIEVKALHPAFNTCNILYSRELLERVGGFDAESFHGIVGGEDCDLAWRAIRAGGKPVFLAEAKVRHAVTRVGPLGMLKVALRWHRAMEAYARHPELRETFTHAIFWKREHYWLLRALLAGLPHLPWPIRAWLVLPYARNLWARGRVLGGGPALAPYYVALDLVETLAVTTGGVRYRTLVL